MIDTRPLNNKTVNFINSIGSLFKNFTTPIAQMDEAIFYQRAVESTGFDDFGDDHYREGFKQVLESAKKDVHFSFLGQFIFTTMMSMNLATRLQLVEKIKRTPQVFQRPIQAPIFIIGMPRSGSTRLHRMMDLDPMLKGPQLWELIRPILLDPPDRRYQTAKREISMSMVIYRGRDHIHYSRAHTPEECVMLLGYTFFSQSFWTQAPVYGYIDWYMQQDRTVPYQEYKMFLQVLQDAYPDQHLLLKAPAHMGSLDQILKLFPDARIIQTHRNPVPVVNSINSLNLSTHIRATQPYDALKTAEHTTELWLAETQRNLAARRENPGKVYDVYFRDFVADPIETIRGIYTHYHLAWPQGFDQQLEQYIRDNPRNKFGEHTYASSDFGTTDEAIFNKFAAYCESFGYTDQVLGLG